MPKDMNRLLIEQIRKQLLELYPVQDAVQHEVEKIAPMEMEREDTRLQVGACMQDWWLEEHRPGLHIDRKGFAIRTTHLTRMGSSEGDEDDPNVDQHRDEGILDTIWNRRR